MTATTVRATIKNRADTAAAFAAANPVLELGEIGVESDTLEFKIGDGVTAWSSLVNPYQTAGNADFTQNIYLNNANIVFEGATADDFETTLTVVDPTADNTITLPDVTGTVVTTGDTGTVTSTMILDGTILDADVNASAAIAGTKISPDFGSQTVVTTGSVGIGNTSPSSYNSAADNLVIGSTGDNGITIATGDSNQGSLFFADGTSGTAVAEGYLIYVHGANEYMAFGTANEERIRVTTAGRVGVGLTSPNNPLHIYDATQNVNLMVESGDANAYIGFKDNSTTSYTSVYLGAEGNELAFYTASGERVRIDDAGRMGIGTNDPDYRLTIATSGTDLLRLKRNGAGGGAKLRMENGDSNYYDIFADGAENLTFSYNGSEAMRIDSDGNVGIGVSDPSNYENNFDNLVVGGTGDNGITVVSGTTSTGTLAFADGQSGADKFRGYIQYFHDANRLALGTNGLAQVHIDSLGNVGIGASSITNLSGYAQLALEDSNGGFIDILDDGVNQARIIGSGNELTLRAPNTGGEIAFDTNGSFERMRISSDGNVGIGTIDPSGPLVVSDDGAAGLEFFPATFEIQAYNRSTSSYGLARYNAAGHQFAVSGTEKAQIDSSGRLLIGTTNVTPAANNVAGTAISGDSYLSISRSSDLAIEVNRMANDGKLMRFLQAGTEEGDITVSGTTVSYNGAHLSRWSQLASGTERIEILRGSVLSNLDEMCEWGEEDNEQLNRMKVSDVEGDRNVAGVFQAWDDDDDTYTNDFYCAMTGDFVIRIAQGTTVARGDLLMSAGDGTAKPQDDDIVRSKTIAKVTSTTVSETYSDGSYCVPCVLMAC